MAKTFAELITLTIREISMSAGPGVQTYAEDRIAAKLQKIFNMVFDELWWPDYMRWYQRTLDGAQGVTTVNLDDIRKWSDIRAVFASNRDQKLPLLPMTINPYRLSGTSLKFISRYSENDSSGRIIQFWPKTATGDVAIHARIRPVNDFIPTDEILMDSDVLVQGAAYDYTEDDGANPGQVAKFQNAFETRLNQLKEQHNNFPVALNSYTGAIPNEWWEA